MNFQEAIYHSSLFQVDRANLSAMSLLYDRVIVPFADFAASGNSWAERLLVNCPGTQAAVEATESLRECESAACRPLTPEDTGLVNSDQHGFISSFLDYARKYGITEEQWRAKVVKYVDVALDALNFYLTEELRRTKPQASFVVAFSGFPYSIEEEHRRMALALELDLESTIIPRFEIDPSAAALTRARAAVCDMETRYALRAELADMANTLAQRVAEANSVQEKKNIIREQIIQLRKRYFDFGRSLEALQREGVIRLAKDKRCNLIPTVRHFLVRKETAGKAAVNKSFLAASIEERYGSYIESCVDSEVFRSVGHLTWQWHLLTMEARLEKAFQPTLSERGIRFYGWIREYFK